MRFIDYWSLVRRYWQLLAVLTAAGVVLAGIVSLAITPKYAAETKVFISMQATRDMAALQLGNAYTQARIQAYADAAVTPEVLAPVIEDRRVDQNAAEFAERVNATADAATGILTISVTDAEPERAAELTASVRDSLIDVVTRIETDPGTNHAFVQLTTMSPATVPLEPATPNVPLNLAAGMVLGMLAAVGTVFVRERLDNRIRSEAVLEQISDVPFLGGLVHDVQASRDPLILSSSGPDHRAEAFRHLRTSIQFTLIGSDHSSILVTSPDAGDGKTTTAANLAISIAATGRKTALVEADLRRPRLGEYFGLEGSVGLTTVLVGGVDLSDALQPWGDDELYVLSSGRIPPNPAEILGSAAMTQLLADLEGRFDVVVVDGAPLLPVTDSAVVAPMVGGVVLVTNARETRIPAFQRATQTLEMVNARVLGTVLNGAPARGPDAYGYVHQYSTSAYLRPVDSPEPDNDVVVPVLPHPRLPLHEWFVGTEGDTAASPQPALNGSRRRR